MLRGCVMAGLILTSHCDARPVLRATDQPRCVSKPGRIKAPRPIHRSKP